MKYKSLADAVMGVINESEALLSNADRQKYVASSPFALKGIDNATRIANPGSEYAVMRNGTQIGFITNVRAAGNHYQATVSLTSGKNANIEWYTGMPGTDTYMNIKALEKLFGHKGAVAEAKAPKAMIKYPDSREGVIALLSADLDKSYLKHLDLPNCKFLRDGSVEGVWAVDNEKTRERYVVYLCGYKDSWGKTREYNDYESGEMPKGRFGESISESVHHPEGCKAKSIGSVADFKAEMRAHWAGAKRTPGEGVIVSFIRDDTIVGTWNGKENHGTVYVPQTTFEEVHDSAFDEDEDHVTTLDEGNSRSWAILPATMALYNKKVVDIYTAASEWTSDTHAETILVCGKNENGRDRTLFIAGAGDSSGYYKVGQSNETHHDQTGASKGVYTVRNIVVFKGGEIIHKENDIGLTGKFSVAVFK